MNADEMFNKIQAQVRDGFTVAGNATSLLFLEGRSVAWLIGAVHSLEQTAKLLRGHIEKNTDAAPLIFVANEIAEMDCHTSGIFVRTKGDKGNE